MDIKTEDTANCTLLLSTYDGGEDLWEGFFKALSVQWPELRIPVVINTETKKYLHPGYSIRTINAPKPDMPWGARLINVLKQIDTPYVLLFLEDYWLDSRVNEGAFRQVIQWMDENPDIATFSFYPCMPGKNIDDGKFPGYELRPQKCEYKLNCQVAVWRRSKLLHYIRRHESPWEFEIWGSKRASRYKERFYSYKSFNDLPFSYGDPEVGCVIHRGKWVKEPAIRLADMYGLNIDFSIRGFEDFDQFRHPPKPKYTLKNIFIKGVSFIQRKCREILSYL